MKQQPLKLWKGGKNKKESKVKYVQKLSWNSQEKKYFHHILRTCDNFSLKIVNEDQNQSSAPGKIILRDCYCLCAIQTSLQFLVKYKKEKKTSFEESLRSYTVLQKALNHWTLPCYAWVPWVHAQDTYISQI